MIEGIVVELDKVAAEYIKDAEWRTHLVRNVANLHQVNVLDLKSIEEGVRYHVRVHGIPCSDVSGCVRAIQRAYLRVILAHLTK